MKTTQTTVLAALVFGLALALAGCSLVSTPEGYRVGGAAYPAMFAAIEAATDHVNLESYIIEDDEVGRQFSELLLQKALARAAGQCGVRQRWLHEYTKGILRSARGGWRAGIGIQPRQ